MSEILIPQIITSISGKEHVTNPISYDLEKNRKIKIVGEINDVSASLVCSQLSYLEKKGTNKPVIVEINSPGGSVTAGMQIYDMIKYGITCDVITIGTGMAASMGAFLLAAGTPGKRYATPTAEIMIHQPLGGVSGQATDISLVAEHIQFVKKRLAEILASECKKSFQQVLEDTERDRYMSSKEALKYGLIDHIGYPGREMEVDYA